MEEFLVRVEIVAWDSPAALQYAKLRSAMEDSGTSIGNLDLMIAAHALSAGAVLVSRERMFQRLKHLKVEDWTRR